MAGISDERHEELRSILRKQNVLIEFCNLPVELEDKKEETDTDEPE